MTAIRERLENIFSTEGSDEFCPKWKLFAETSDHTFKLIEPPLTAEQICLKGKMNCYAYALELYKLPSYSRWVDDERYLYCQINVLTGRVFGGLIEQGLLAEIPDADVTVNSLVVYISGDNITHCGTIIRDNKRVRSKFNIKEFYEHGLMEVRTSFGFPTKYLKRPTYKERLKIMASLAKLPPFRGDMSDQRP